MSLFHGSPLANISTIDWEMTPDYTFGTYESWGGKERVRDMKERIYYFFIDAWGEEPKVCLMERGVKHARVVAEILAPLELVRRCVQEQGKVAFFERTHPINEELKSWLIANVVETDDDSKVIVLNPPVGPIMGDSGLPGSDEADLALPPTVRLPDASAEMSEDDVLALVTQYNFAEQERNPQGLFVNAFVDNGDGLTVTDRVTGLMWQRGGTDIMSYRAVCREAARMNLERFAGFSDWCLPSIAEALSLLEREKSNENQYIHPCFSPEQPFIFVEASRRPGGRWFVDYKQGRAFWASGTIPGGFGRFCRRG